MKQMIPKTPLILAGMLLTVPLVMAGLQGEAEVSRYVPMDSMQVDESNPIWAAIRNTGLDGATGAQLMLTDGDGNGRTDFLDLVVETAESLNLLDTPVELLVYADDATHDDLLAQIPGADEITDVGTFLTLKLNELDALDRPGVELVVWEPRMYSTATNPAAGNPAGLAQISISNGGSAWSTATGAGVKVAILDTGVHVTHDAFSGAGKWSDWKDCQGPATGARDIQGHGTHVASTAAGRDGTQFKGMAPDATVVPIQVLSDTGSGSASNFQCGVNHVKALKNNGDTIVASASLGLGVPPLGWTTLNGGDFDLFGFDRVADQLPAAGVPFAVAAGNCVCTVIEIIGLDETTQVGVNGVNQIASPGFANSVITVGALTYAKDPAHFTALGPGKNFPMRVGEVNIKPDVAAHGFQTWGAQPSPANNNYVQMSGTSMATPGVAGVVALMLEQDPTLTPAQVKAKLHSCAGTTYFWSSPVAHVRPNFVTGYGVADAAAVLSGTC